MPNTQVINNTAASYTNFPHLRVSIPVNVNVQADLGLVRSTMLGLVEGEAEYMTDPEPKVVVTELNDYNVKLELRVWVHDERRHEEIRTSLLEAVYLGLVQAGVDMPFETFRLEPFTVRNAPALASP